MDHNDRESGKNGSFSSRANIALIGFLAIAGFYLITEHRAHLLGWLPFLILLACPLLHVFMHGGHGEHAGHDTDGEPKDGRSNITTHTH